VTLTPRSHQSRHSFRRRPNGALPVLVAVFALVLTLASPALAQPTTPPDEGGGSSELATLRANLEAAAAGWLDAEAALAASTAKQAELQDQLTLAEMDITRAKVGVSRYAAEAYKTGPLGTLGAILSATSPDQFLTRAAEINKRVHHDQVQLAKLSDAHRRASDAKAAIDAEIQTQRTMQAEMTKRRQAAEKALSSMGGYAINGWMDPNSPAARPAPRNANGSWPREYCTINDPTTSGCITPRTLHALQEAQRNGFKRYVSCFRSGNQYEHPKGRACDFSAHTSGFSDSNAGGDDRVYGDKLASFFVKNAIALGVMYVVWYCKVWIVGSGWKNYSSTGSKCGDSPAGDHTNHVHVSIY
jgi:peptidoglycan DL-endopeptidase CwlO